MTSYSEPAYPPEVEIIEVGPRDGLQREKVHVPAAQKLALIQGLVRAGLRRIQATSFVHPRLVPQMADAEEVCAGLPKAPGVIFSGLVLNLKGLERAFAAGLTHVDMSVSASDAHSQRNANRTVAKALADYDEMYAQARAFGMTVRGGIQCAFGFQRPDDVAPKQVLSIAEHFLALGVDELALADSAGLANPRQVARLLQDLIPLMGNVPLILHLHDTRGMGMANVLAALECGVHHFDTALGGLGGCPFIDGAAGNIATEDTVFMLHEMGIQTGVDPRRVAQVSRHCAEILGKSALPSKLYALLA